MNQHHQNIANLIQQFESLTAEQKNAIAKSLKDADKELEIASFKLERTEKVKRTTAILLEETIQELEQKRKAVEGQNRELEIEAALEKVRSRTMGMQKSEELSETAVLLFHQLISLGLDIKGCGFNIWEKEEKICTSWMNGPDGELNPPFRLPLTEDPFFIRYYESRQSGEDFWVYETGKEELAARYKYLRTLPVIGELLAKDSKDRSEIDTHSVLVDHVVNFSNGNLIFITNKVHPEAWDIFKRFGKVFEQTYTRFLDLQKAEAQAREGQIQLAMERVRARTMAMQRSNELAEVATVLFQQVKGLGVNQWLCGFSIWEIGDKDFTWYPGSPDGDILPPCKIPLTEHPVFISFDESRRRGDELFIYEKGGEFQAEHYRYMLSLPGLRGLLQNMLDAGLSFPSFQIDHLANFSHGNLAFITYEHFPEMHDIFKRFAKVFEQTYTRFLDLQKAEAQAREAQVEAALERIRAKSMAMRQSDELTDLSLELAKQVQALGVATWHCAFNIYDDDQNCSWEWGANAESAMPIYKTPREGVFLEYYELGQKGEMLHINEIGEDKCADHYEYLCTLPGVGDNLRKVRDAGIAFPKSQIDHVAYFKYGYLLFITFEPAPAAHDIFKRFANVFEQTYTRFLDLQKAEVQAREAIKRASVDRVRGDIASMRTTNDLERIQPLIWNELTTLGVPFIRCGVFIMDEEQQKVHTFLSTPEGKAIATLHVPFDFDLSIIYNGVSHWREKKIYKEYWDAAAFTKSWTALSSSRETPAVSTHQEQAPEDLHLHLLPFLQGMLYVGNDAPLNEEELQVVQNLADAFATAYARYEDFNKLESAKVQIEKTLVDLKQAQSQLIQSEKMASLGELTAGIAHEIQNPLNFVNNFSEVNRELLAELHDAIEKEDYKEVKIIAKDISGNEEKISHHGKRADAIVKGMLQHSRSSSAIKEPTDINKLADEYLRLAYHGLRAKDKSFNATLKTDYDESIGSINVIPQDIGRAILNLITNAFYVVGEKKKQQGGGYESTVSVSTKMTGNKVEVSVKDNGNGIPQKVLDKIFQPFFTTKPTGQGTGLGLSLTYDIIKAHGGEIIVKTSEGEGSTFHIFLPITNV